MNAPPAPPNYQLSSVKPDGSRKPIHPIDVKGRFIRWRRVAFAVLIAIYVAAPLITIGGHPAMHLDIERRHFYLLGGTFNAQDFWLMLFMGTAFGFGLLFVTAWRGRLWCGWACPQTVFLEAVYRPIERLFDGPREKRMKLEGARWTAGRVARVVAKNAAYVAVSLLLSHVALSLFLSASELRGMVLEGPQAHPTAFAWSMAVTFLLYFNFTWFREQMCVVICPYGRLQSVLHDRDSIIIGYDARRGEPRGHLQKGAPAAERLGDCIDCGRCVTACPTAIDIRHGLQMECVACAQCVDACDEVMDKVGRPRGLIRYSSLNLLAGLPSKVLRPRLLLYATLGLVASTALAIALSGRRPFEANVLRDHGLPFRLEGGMLYNKFEVHLVNKHPDPARFKLEVTSPVPATIELAQPEVTLAPFADLRMPVQVGIEHSLVTPGLELDVVVTDQTSGQVRHQELHVLGPPSHR